MNGYPDDIRMYDDDPRSPFYSGEDPHIVRCPDEATADNLTPGREYTIDTIDAEFFTLISDDGEALTCTYLECTNIDDMDWEVVQ